MQLRNFLLITAIAAMISACSPKEKTEMAVGATLDSGAVYYGSLPDGKKVNVYTLTNKNGVELKVINYGGIVTSLKVPDNKGVMTDVVLGYDSLASYLEANPYFGAIIGRYGNRIGGAKFSLEGSAYELAANDNGNHLHGGNKGFDKVFWNIETIDSGKIKLTYKSADGEEGYPGNLDVQVIYSLSDDNTFQIEYFAKTDRATVVNLTQHTYFNLNGHNSRDILNHELELAAPSFLPVDKGLIPTGEIRPVAGTPFDFTKVALIGARISDKDEQLEFGKGYDHCWVFSESAGSSLRTVGKLRSPGTGIEMEILTTEPAIQFYSGNFLDGKNIGKGGYAYQFRDGLCLETQHFPDSPNKPSFPSTELRPDQVYHTTTAYRFGVR